MENLPREMRARAKRGDQEMGITCISFNKEDNTNFLIGSESGGVFRCSTSTRGAPASSKGCYDDGYFHVMKYNMNLSK